MLQYSSNGNNPLPRSPICLERTPLSARLSKAITNEKESSSESRLPYTEPKTEAFLILMFHKDVLFRWYFDSSTKKTYFRRKFIVQITETSLPHFPWVTLCSGWRPYSPNDESWLLSVGDSGAWWCHVDRQLCSVPRSWDNGHFHRVTLLLGGALTARMVSRGCYQ